MPWVAFASDVISAAVILPVSSAADHLKIHKMTWLEENSESEGHNSARCIQVSICRPGHSKGFKKVCEDDVFLYVLSSAQVVFYSNQFLAFAQIGNKTSCIVFLFFTGVAMKVLFTSAGLNMQHRQHRTDFFMINNRLLSSSNKCCHYQWLCHKACAQQW